MRVTVCGNPAARSVHLCVVRFIMRAECADERSLFLFSEPLDHVIGVRIPASQPTISF
jgi:hypothetical protein